MGTPDGTVQGPGGGRVTGAQPGRGAAPAERPRGPAAPAGDGRSLALELLVHGVGGAPAQEMLGDPHVVRMTGDATAGTYRRWHDRDAERHPGRYRDGAVPEAYCWGGLTSGARARALWLLLLPFTVVNLAHWMRPARGERGAPGLPTAAEAGYDLLVRLAALLLTVLFTATLCETALDLTAWQCAGSARCTAGRPWLGFVSAARGGWWSLPGRRLALASLLPLAGVALLWWLSHRTWSAYEAQRMAPAAGAPGAAAPAAPMEQPGFWYGRRLVLRLRVVHAAAALLTIGAALTVPPLRADLAAGRRLGSALGFGLTGVFAVLAAAAGGVLGRSWRCEQRSDESRDRVAVRGLHWTALAAVAAAAVYAAWSRPGWQSHGRLPGSTTVLAVLCAGQLLLVPLLAAAAALLGRRPSGQPRRSRPGAVPGSAAGPGGAVAAGPPVVPGPARGLEPADEGFGGPGGAALHRYGGPATVLLAFALGTLLSAGTTCWTSERLTDGAPPGQPGAALPGPPPLLTWHAAAAPVALLCLAVPGAVLLLRTLRLRSALRSQVEAAYGVTGRGSPRRTGQIAGALAGARLTEAGPLLIGTLAGLAFAAGGAALCGAWLTGEGPAAAARRAPGFPARVAEVVQPSGVWLCAGLVVALALLGRAAYRSAAVRRTVGILWDVGTFWPRAAHPFAPPCYAERAVPDLVWRLRAWLDADPDRRAVLAAHSQGTVLAAAALWQLDRATRRRVALLTCGSPLRRLYGRYFPAFMGPAELARLHADAPAWRNLFRLTDPIGGPVRLPGVDVPPLTDPPAYDRHLPDSPLPEPIRRHSDYWSDPAHAEQRADLLRRV